MRVIRRAYGREKGAKAKIERFTEAAWATTVTLFATRKQRHSCYSDYMLSKSCLQGGRCQINRVYFEKEGH